MKKIFTLFIATIAIALTSCRGKEAPVDLVNQLDIAKVEVVAIEGHLHGKYGFHETADPKDQVHMKRFNKFVFVRKANGSMELDPSSVQKLCVTGGVGQHVDHDEHAEEHEGHHHHDESEAGSVYGMWIDYFDAQGNKITDKVIGGENGKHRQHFFVPRGIKPTFDGDQKTIDQHKEINQFMTYVYCDTDPLSARIKDGAKVSGETNPIGYKGYLGFFVPRSEFTLEVVLSDVGSEGKSSAFWKALPTNKTLMKLAIPVVVYADYRETVESETMEELTEADRKYLESIAHAYGITTEEALKALLNRVYGDVPPHSDAGYWF